MATVEWVFHTRWILWALGLSWLAICALRRGLWVPRLPDRAFMPGLAALCLGFFALAAAAKLLQLRSLALHAQDFWLFEDMLRQLGSGGPFLTRFAPHEPGWVQHGAIHTYWTFHLALSLSWLVDTMTATLLHGPLCFALAGAVLGLLLRKRLGTTAALVFVFGFLFSSYAGKAVMYEAHPESAYPLMVFLWMLGCGFDSESAKPRPWLWIPALVAGMGVRIDSFLVFIPLAIAAWWMTDDKGKRATLAASCAIAAMIAVAQFHAIAKYGSGEWGPALWNTQPVSIPKGDPRFLGKRWDSPAIVLEVLSARVGSDGSVLSVAWSFLEIFISRSWLALVIVAPWLLLRRGFWISVLPVALTLNLLGELAKKMMLYYATPLLGAFWGWAGLLVRGSREKAAAWVFFATCLLSPGDLELARPAQGLDALRAEARALNACARPGASWVVKDPWIGEISREHVFGDAFPRGFDGRANPATITGAVVSVDPAPDSLFSSLISSGWVRLRGVDCLPFDSVRDAGFPALLVPPNPAQ